MRRFCSLALLSLASCAFAAQPAKPQDAAHPGARTLMDAHNCYPYYGWWNDRIDRALSAGTPLAIEQDLFWYTDPKTGATRSLVAHGDPLSGHEPSMEQYFFRRVQPIVERALREGNHGDWPLITLNLDFKTEEPEHLAAVWALLSKYSDWLTTAPKSGGDAPQPLTVRPILVLTGESDAQQRAFYDHVPDGERLLVFGAAHTHSSNPMAAPEVLEPAPATNYRRWWNNPWSIVEEGGQTRAGAWTHADDARLHALVDHSHRNGLWIRFYTLDGEAEKDESCGGWFHNYNFGSPAAVEQRWKAAQQAGVDYIASDHYEALGAFLRRQQSRTTASASVAPEPPSTCRR